MLRRLDGGLSALEMMVLGIGMAAAVAVATIQVALRYATGSDLYWAQEFIAYTIVWTAFLSAGAGVRAGQHLTVEILLVCLDAQTARHVNRVVAVLGVVSGAALTVYGAQFVLSAYEFGQVSPAMQLPMWAVYLVVPASGLLLVIRFLQNAFMPAGNAEPHSAETLC
jgi:C4-dicarboxylate transporter DctQ subunit